MNRPSDPPELRMLPAPPPSPASRNPQRGKKLALSKVKNGQEVKITSIQLGPAKRDQLYDQGIRVTRHARVLHNDHKGRVILRIGSELFILGRLETARMFVVVT